MSNDYGDFYGILPDLTNEDMQFLDELHEKNNLAFSITTTLSNSSTFCRCRFFQPSYESALLKCAACGHPPHFAGTG